MSKFDAASKAIEDWGKTARFCVILLVMALCLVVPVLVAWLLVGHGVSAAEVARVVGWFSR